MSLEQHFPVEEATAGAEHKHVCAHSYFARWRTILLKTKPG
jgi:hypothetical protein